MSWKYKKGQFCYKICLFLWPGKWLCAYFCNTSLKIQTKVQKKDWFGRAYKNRLSSSNTYITEGLLHSLQALTTSWWSNMDINLRECCKSILRNNSAELSMGPFLRNMTFVSVFIFILRFFSLTLKVKYFNAIHESPNFTSITRNYCDPCHKCWQEPRSSSIKSW